MRMFTFAVFFLTSATLIQGIRVNITELGAVEGSTTTTAWTNRTIYQFLNLKYALSPSGNRRFMPPISVTPWDGIYNATEIGIECPQYDTFDEILNAPPDKDMEDCLLLNVFTPKIPDSSNITNLLPVMIYIHGGGFYEGSARPFPPNYLLESDIVLVVIQYRLGPLGFMSLQIDGIAGNVGFMDQVLAFEWVNKHIYNFGGDNSRVTIFGQSAGACSVSLHLLSPMVKSNLFQQAIVHSGSSYADWALDLNPEEYARNLFTYLTNSTDDVSDNEMEEVFKSVSVLEFMLAVFRQTTTNPLMMRKVGRVVVQRAGEVKYLTELPKYTLMKGNYKTLPMIAGVTKHDGSFLLTTIYDQLENTPFLYDSDYYRNNLTYSLLYESGLIDETNILVDTFNDIYFRELFSKKDNISFADIAPGAIDILGNAFLKSQTLKQAKINSIYENDTYFYTLDYRGEHTRFGYGQNTSKYPFDGGVHHSDDLLYLYPFPYKNPLNEEDTKIAKLMTELWTNFAISGKPTSSLLDFDWPVLEKNKNGPYLHINSTSYTGDDFVYEQYRIASLESGLITN